MTELKKEFRCTQHNRDTIYTFVANRNGDKYTTQWISIYDNIPQYVINPTSWVRAILNTLQEVK